MISNNPCFALQRIKKRLEGNFDKWFKDIFDDNPDLMKLKNDDLLYYLVTGVEKRKYRTDMSTYFKPSSYVSETMSCHYFNSGR